MAYLSRTSSAKSERLSHTSVNQPTHQNGVDENADPQIEQDFFITEVDVNNNSGYDISDVKEKNGLVMQSLEDEEDETGTENVMMDYSSNSDSDGYDTDLETECVVEPRIQDLTGEALYKRLCSKVGVVPLSCVQRNINKENLHMPHRGIGVNGVKALAPPVAMNNHARRLNLENNMIGPEGCLFIANIVNANVFVTELNLSYNQIGSEGIAQLCLPIRDSNSIIRLDLSNNGFEDQDAHYFADIIENNISLRSLNLSRNLFSVQAGKIFGTAIANNDTLETFDLSWNALRLEGAEAFAKGVATNMGLKTLNLAMNGFSNEGTRAIGIALTLNKYLEHLDLSFNRISNSAAIDFARYFRINTMLKTLKIFGNPIMADGAEEIIKTIAENERCSVHHLDMRGLMVHKEFLNYVKQINDRRPFTAEIGMVSQGVAITGQVDRFADKNPLEILLIFMGEQNLRLVDLFRSFDKDQSGGLTRDEFINGLQEVKTPLTRSQLDELLDMLDKDGDGEIDLKEILNINREFRDIKLKAQRYVAEEKQQKKLEREGKKETELEAFTKDAMAIKQRSITSIGMVTEKAAEEAQDEVPRAQTSIDESVEDQKDTSIEPVKVTTEEAAELNQQVTNIKAKGLLGKWKSKTLV